MNQSQHRGRLRLRHLQEANEAISEEMAAQRPRFQRLAREDSAPRAFSSFNLFQTPPELATRLVAILGRSGRTLEPSAGLGRLYRAFRASDTVSPVVLVEQSADCCGELYRSTEGDAACRLLQGDFLEKSPGSLGLFDCVLMNPPFKMGRDVKHIQHALKFLAPGGRLVSICGTGSRRDPLREIATEWHELPPGSFKCEGTNAGACVFVFDL